MEQTNRRLKPFLTVTEVNKDFVTVGVTSRYRVSFPNDLSIRHPNEICKYNPYLSKLGLLNEIETELEEASSRTASFLSLLSKKPTLCLDNIRQTNFLILGVGGLGSRIALELASLGVESLTIVDPDALSLSNLQRMFYFDAEDVGQKKVDLIKKRCHSISPNTAVSGIPKDSIDFVNQSNLIGLYDFIFVTADAEDGTMSKHVGK